MDSPRDPLALADWRRRVSELYGRIRDRAAGDPPGAHRDFIETRDRLFRTHPSTPLGESARRVFAGLSYAPYRPGWRVVGRVEHHVARDTLALDSGGDGTLTLVRVGRVAFLCPEGDGALDLFWVSGTAEASSYPSATLRTGGARTGEADTCTTPSRARTSGPARPTWCWTSTSPTTPPARTTIAGPARWRRRATCSPFQSPRANDLRDGTPERGSLSRTPRASTSASLPPRLPLRGSVRPRQERSAHDRQWSGSGRAGAPRDHRSQPGGMEPGRGIGDRAPPALATTRLVTRPRILGSAPPTRPGRWSRRRVRRSSGIRPSRSLAPGSRGSPPGRPPFPSPPCRAR